MLLHASRKTFSNVKVSISAQWTPPFYNASASPVEVSGCSVTSRTSSHLKSYLACLLYDCDSWVTVTASEVGPQPLVCKWRAGHAVPGSFGLHLPLLICCGEWLTQWDWGKKGEGKYLLLVYDAISWCVLCQGLYLSGVIGDRVNLRYVLCFGLCGSAAVVSSLPTVVFRGLLRLSCPEPSVRLQEFVFGTVTEWLGLYNVYLYCSLWVLNGLLQSAVWPCVVAVMANWFGKSGCVCLFILSQTSTPVNFLNLFCLIMCMCV